MTETNSFGWHLPVTDSMLNNELPYPAFEDPAMNVAERLVMLAHRSFSPKVWGAATGRGGRYWEALGEHVRTCANAPTVAVWWDSLMVALPGVPLRSIPLLHEKNILCHPTSLPTTSVQDADVLEVLRTQTLDLRDRTRVWVKYRREMREEMGAGLAEPSGEVDDIDLENFDEE